MTEGTAVTLTCVGTGDTVEEPLYSWYRNSRRLQEGSLPTLEFPSVRADDAGTFQCQVRSRNGSDTSEAVPLRVLCEFSGNSKGNSWGCSHPEVLPIPTHLGQGALGWECGEGEKFILVGKSERRNLEDFKNYKWSQNHERFGFGGPQSSSYCDPSAMGRDASH